MKAANGADTWQGSAGSSDWLTGTDWAGSSTNKPPISGDSLVFSSTNLSTSGTLTNTLTTSAFNINGITFNASAIAYTMTGNTFNLTSGITNNSNNTQTFANTGGLTESTGYTFTMGTGGTGAITISGGLTNTSGGAVTNTVNGAGTTLTLGGFNVNTGGNRIVSIINGSGNVLITGTITGGDSVDGLTYAGTGNLTIAGLYSFNSNGSSLNVSSGTLTLSGTQSGAPNNVSGSGVFNETSTGVIQNNGGAYGGFSQASTGTSTLAGSNLYQNGTTISAGGLILSGTMSGGSAISTSNGAFFKETASGLISNGSLTQASTGTSTLFGINTYSGGTAVNAGTLLLDFSQATTPASAVNIIGTGSALTLGGGTLTIKGGGSGDTNSQKVNGTTLTAATASAIVFQQNFDTTLSGSLGTITRNAGSTLDITLPTAGVVTAVSGTTNTVLTSASTAYMTVNGGAAFATITGGTIGVLNPAGTYGATGNVNVGTADAPAAGLGANTLTFNGANDQVTFSGSNVITAGGILVTPSSSGSDAILSGTIQAGLGKELVVQNYGTGSLLISSTIADSSSGASALTLKGPGLTILSNANTFTGQTTLLSGTLDLSNGLALQNSTLQYNTAGNLIFDAAGGTAFTLGGLSSGQNIALQNSAGAAVALTVGGNNANTTYSGILSGSGSVTKIGTGTFNFTVGANQTYSGGLIIDNGSVTSANSESPVGTGSVTLGLAGSANGVSLNTSSFNGAIIVEPGTVGSPGTASRSISNNSGSAATFGGPVTLIGGATLNPAYSNGGFTFTGGFSGTGNLVTSGGSGGGGLTISGANPFNVTGLFENLVNGNTGAVTISSVIGPNGLGLIENATSNLILSAANTFTGDTTVTKGVLNLRNALALQNSVLVTNTNNEVTFGTSTTVGLSAVTLGGLAGTGSINLNDTLTTPAAVALTIGNSNVSNGSVTNPNTLNPVYSGNLTNTPTSGASLTKVGSNTQTLSGSNSYSGGTTVTSGSLVVGNNNALGTGSLAVNGGTLDLGGFSITSTSLTGSAGAVITSNTNVSTTGTLTAAVNGVTNTYGGAIVDGTFASSLTALTLTSLSSGTEILTGNSTYSGPTTINNGATLRLTGSLGNTAVAVNSGGVLTAVGNGSTTGAIAGAVTVGGNAGIDFTKDGLVLTPSAGTTTLTVGGLTLTGGTNTATESYLTFNGNQNGTGPCQRHRHSEPYGQWQHRNQPCLQRPHQRHLQPHYLPQRERNSQQHLHLGHPCRFDRSRYGLAQ